MAQFRAIITNGRDKTISRLGHKSTGLTVDLNAWEIGVRVIASHINGEDVLTIQATGGSNAHTHPEAIATIKTTGIEFLKAKEAQ